MTNTKTETTNILETLSNQYGTGKLANNSIDMADKATLKFNSSISEPDYLKTLYGQVRIGMTCQSPSDNENLLSTPKNCLKIFETLFPLLEILNSFNWCRKPIKNKFYEAIKQWDDMPLNLNKNILGASIQGELGIILVESAQLINHFLIQSKFNLDEFKILIHETKNSLDLIENNYIKTKDVNDILEGISRIFPDIKFPEFKAEKRIKPSNKAFKIKQIEATPNHSTCLDILSLIIKPQEFSDKANFSDMQINHKSKRFNAYTALKVPLPETVEINDINLTLVKCFDWKDRKILRLIFTEALHHQGEFALSFRWILEKLGELKTGGKTLEEKLEDLRSRFLKYRSVSIRWKYKLGKKIEANSITGGNIFIIQTTDFYDSKRGGNSYDIQTNISLGNWFEINRNLIREFTRIPQKLLSINTTYHWRAFAIGEKICVLMRTNKEKILHSNSAYQVPIKLSMKCLLNEIINPLELKQCLEDSKKGYDFKDSFIKETQYLEKKLGWKFNWIGLTENQSLNDFYNSVSFIAYVDSELESAILGEKLITEIVTPKSNLTVTDLITALETHKNNPKVSIRNLTKDTLNKKHPWLQRRLDPSNNLFGKLTKKELNDCIKEINRLTKLIIY